jgi:hypothetical protein
MLGELSPIYVWIIKWEPIDGIIKGTNHGNIMGL